MQLQQIYVQSTQGSFTSSMTHRRETCILKNTVMKQSRELSGDLKPEHTNKTQRTTMNPTTGNGSQSPTV